MQEENMYGIRLWYWLKVIYESATKLDPIRRLYGEKIWFLKLKSGGSLDEYIDNFQGFSIFHWEIGETVDPEDKLVTQMVEHIEDPLLSVPCESIKNWYRSKISFRDAAATMQSHKISKMTS